MKIFILGRPQSGRSTVAKALCQDRRYCYVDGSHWIKQSFRSQKNDEHIEQYQDTYHQHVNNKLVSDTDLSAHMIGHIFNYIESEYYVIDGVVTPRDFISLFDYNEDFVVFLNRNDDEDVSMKDYEKIGISVMRDYCFWMSAAGLLKQERWLEFNFKMTGGDPNRLKKMGSKNTVWIVGSLDKAILILKDVLPK